VNAIRIRDTPREQGFDVPPARGVVGIAVRQAPQAMQVIRQDHDGFDRERPRGMRGTERRTQVMDPVNQ